MTLNKYIQLSVVICSQVRSWCKLSFLVRFYPLNTTVISHTAIFKKSLERDTKNVFLKTKIVFSTKQLKKPLLQI